MLVLREESVPRMDRLGVGLPRNLKDLIDREIALARRRRPNEIGLVRPAHVQAVAVGLRIHCHGPQSKLRAGTQNPDRDLAAVGDQDFSKRR